MSDVPAPPPDLRLVPAAGVAWAGAAAAVGLDPPVTGVAGALALVAAAVVAGPARGRSGSRRVTAVALALAVLGVVLAQTAVRVAVTTHGPVAGLVRQGASVEAVVVVRTDAARVRPDPARSWQDEERWVVRVLARELDGRGTRAPSRAPLVVLGGEGWDDVAPDETLRVRGRLAPTDRGDAAVGLLLATGPPDRLAPAGPVWAAATRVREGLRTACAGLPPDARGLLPSLVVGDTSGLMPDLEDDMRTTGLTHLAAVSGANFTLLCGAAVLALTAVGARRRTRVSVAVAVALGFVVLARPEPSVLRAACMGLVGLAGLAGSRRAAGVPALSVAVVVLCVVDPWLSRSAGFALSVLATGGLLVLAGPWTRALEPRVPRWLAAALAVPLAAQAVCAPVTVLLAPQVSLVAVPANVLVAPAVAPATVVGVLAAVVAPVWPQGAAWLAWLAGWPVRWVAAVARTGADVPHAAVPWPAGPAGAVLLAALTVVVLVVAALLLRRPVRRGRLRLHRVAVPTAAGVAVVVLVQVGVADPLLGHRAPGRAWQVAACDVGQGQAVAVRTGDRSALLVDAGPDADLVDRCLRRLDVEVLDLVVLTHFHADHVDGLAGAVRGRAVGAVAVSPLALPVRGVEASTAAAAGAGLRLHAVVAGTRWVLGDDVEVEVLWPTAAAGALHDDGDEAVNDASVVLHVRTGDGLSLLATGDLEPPGQQALLAALGARPDLVPVDVVTVAHHGSAHQHPALYELVAARVALVSAGTGNDYGHPAASTLGDLEATGALVLRTDTGGDLLVGGGGASTWARAGRSSAASARDGPPRAPRPPRPTGPSGRRGRLCPCPRPAAAPPPAGGRGARPPPPPSWSSRAPSSCSPPARSTGSCTPSAPRPPRGRPAPRSRSPSCPPRRTSPGRWPCWPARRCSRSRAWCWCAASPRPTTRCSSTCSPTSPTCRTTSCWCCTTAGGRRPRRCSTPRRRRPAPCGSTARR